MRHWPISGEPNCSVEVRWLVIAIQDILATLLLEMAMEPIKVRLIEEAALRMGASQAAEWYNTVPVPGFGERTAKDLVEAGRGEEVIGYFRAVDAGVFA